MKNDGGQADAPTSYGLKPPKSPGSHLRDASLPQPKPQQGGRLIGDRYRLHDRLGFGGMGTVWEARDEVVQRDVAVKELRVPEHLSERERATAILRMQREARAAARIDHPAVVTIHDVVMEERRPWIVMELIRGRSLADALDEGSMPPEEAARIVLPVVDALAAAHQAGVLHRDVKPANVLLGAHDRVVLTDFGIAQVEGERQLTETGSFVGSPECMSPERILGQRPGPESDLFSVGVLLYTAVEGWCPFRRQTAPSTLQAILSAEPQQPSRAGDLTPLILQLLSKDPAARPSAVEAGQALRKAANRPVRQPPPAAVATETADPAGAPGPAREAAPRRRRGVWAGLGAAALAAGLAAVLVLVDPFSWFGPPDGWRTYRLSRMNAAIAVPGDYERSESDDSVTFSDPDHVFSIALIRTKGVRQSPLQEGNSTLNWYRSGAEHDYSAPPRYDDGVEQDYAATMKSVDGRVLATTHQDIDAAQVDSTFIYTNDESETRQRRIELFVINGAGVEYDLVVEMPAAKKQAEQGRRIFADVRANLDFDDL